MSDTILAIDQGTTSTRAILFDSKQHIIASHQQEFSQHFPASGWVEHDAQEIWQSVLNTSRTAIEKSGIATSCIAAIGITNQRETTVVWDRHTGEAIYHAIVWQDRRTAAICQQLQLLDKDQTITKKTGLILDPYFSATKIAWILDHVEGARNKAEKGQLLFGTIDSYLLWKFTDGQAHKTDATNASRTMLYNIHTHQWDEWLCQFFNVPMAMLPQVENCNHCFGHTIKHFLGASIPIAGMAGDQHAATIGQSCFQSGMVKSTYGTGCFVMMNTGEVPVSSHHRLLTTIAYQIDNKVNYALEGSIFMAGAVVQWLRDGLKIIDSAEQTESMASQADNSQSIILVPAFAGLGAPYWQPNVRGAIFGLNRNSGPRELARAALESVCLQTRDLIEAMLLDFTMDLKQLTLRVDGGMSASKWTMQCLSDTLGCVVDRAQIMETTALGVAWLAGYTMDVWGDQQAFERQWQLNQRFLPQSDEKSRQNKYQAWKIAVDTTITQSEAMAMQLES